jgi:hypothetical protein
MVMRVIRAIRVIRIIRAFRVINEIRVITLFLGVLELYFWVFALLLLYRL